MPAARALLGAPLVAASFLTTLPIPAQAVAGLPPAAWPRAVGFFPLVGTALGVAVALSSAFAARGLPHGIIVALDLVLLALLSGGLHLDGLADSADGLFAVRDREQRLAIMRTGPVGAYGVAAVVLVLLVEYAALEATPDVGPVLIVAACCSRAAMSLALVAFPYARRTGMGTGFKEGAGIADALLAALIALAVGWMTLGAAGLVLAGLAAVTAAFLGLLATSQLGGLTGDVYGAIGEIAFAVCLLAGAVAPRSMLG